MNGLTGRLMGGRGETYEAIEKRWRPYVFDPVRRVSTTDLEAIFEAARWMMSSCSAPPWRYVVGVRERNVDVWRKILSVLEESNKPWAMNAPVLALGIVDRDSECAGTTPLRDLSAGSAGLTFEATSRGLAVHQMIDIDADKACDIFELPKSMQAIGGLAIGYVGDPSDVHDGAIGAPTAAAERPGTLSDVIIYGSC